MSHAMIAACHVTMRVPPRAPASACLASHHMATPGGALHHSDGSLAGYASLEALLAAHLPPDQLQEAQRVLYGHNCGAPVQARELSPDALACAVAGDFDLQAYGFAAAKEELRPARITRVALVQHSIQASTSASFTEQLEAIHARVASLLDAAGGAGAQVVCLQEAWHMPFAFCTREKRWCEFAEPVHGGPSVALCRMMAKKHAMVVVCPILERDVAHGETVHNTAVVISQTGDVIGTHRKNHIPRVGDFNESTYYMEGETGHPVFETLYGRIAVNICYGRHHPLNWMAFGLNGADIVFNPSATVGALSEPMWPVEARNAAIANSYYVCAINRVGIETFPTAWTSGDGAPAHNDFGPFYGSSYVAAPDGSRTPSLARHRDGVMVCDLDLNLNRQIRDKWGFQMTARYPMYRDLLERYCQPGFQPQVVRDPALPQ